MRELGKERIDDVRGYDLPYLTINGAMAVNPCTLDYFQHTANLGLHHQSNSL